MQEITGDKYTYLKILCAFQLEQKEATEYELLCVTPWAAPTAALPFYCACQHTAFEKNRKKTLSFLKNDLDKAATERS